MSALINTPESREYIKLLFSSLCLMSTNVDDNMMNVEKITKNRS